MLLRCPALADTREAPLSDIRGLIKGRFLLFQVYRNFANLFFKLSASTFYKEIRKFLQKVQT